MCGRVRCCDAGEATGNMARGAALVNININKAHQAEIEEMRKQMSIVLNDNRNLIDELARIKARWTWRVAAWVVGVVKRYWKFQGCK